MRCAAHLLNLVAQNDVKKYLKTYKNEWNVYRNVLTKLKAFWRLSKKSDNAKRTVKENCDTQFPTPVATRWNSLFDAIYKIYQKRKQISTLFNKLQLQKLKVSEWTFVEKYVKIMKPLVEALNTLQGEEHVSLGYVLPTIIVLKNKVENLSHLSACKNLIENILQRINERFPFIDLETANVIF